MKQIKDLPLDDRPYEKCSKYGPEFLTDSELLSVILRTGTAGMNVNELSDRILHFCPANHGLLYLMHATKEELQSIKGVGPVKAMQILCIGELTRRISLKKAEEKLSFTVPKTVAGYYMEKLRHLEHEELVTVYLNSKCGLIMDKVVSTGTVDKTIVPVREIFVDALRCNCVNMLILHNHPSGSCIPSRDDITSTEKLIEAGKLIGINVLDHIIIGNRSYLSMREENYIKI